LARNVDGEIIIGIDQPKSNAVIESDLKSILSQIKDLEAKINQATLSNEAITSLQKQIEDLQTSIEISNIHFNTSQAAKAAQTTGAEIGRQMSDGISSAIQKGDFEKEFSFNKGDKNKVAKVAEQYFQKITDGAVSVREQMDKLDKATALNGFTVGIKHASGEVEELQYVLKKVSEDGKEIFQYTGGNINDSNVEKQAQKVQNSIAKIESDIANFENNNRNILSGLSSPLEDFYLNLEKLRNRTGSIDEVKNSFKRLETEASNIMSNLDNQFNKVDTAVRNIEKGQDTIAGLRAEFKGLTNTPKDIESELNRLSTSLSKIKEIEQTEGRTKNWTVAYKEWEEQLKSITERLRVLKKEQKNAASTQIYHTDDLKKNNVLYMQKVFNTIEKQIEEIQHLSNGQGWQNFKVTGFEEADGLIKKLTLTVTDAEGAMKRLNFQREKLQGRGKAQNGLIQVGDVQIIKTAAETCKELAQEAQKVRSSMDGTGKTDYNLQLAKIEKDYRNLGFTQEEVSQKTEKLSTAHNELRRVIDSTDFSTEVEKNKAIVAADKERIKALNQVSNAYKTLRQDSDKFYNEKKQINLTNRIQKWLETNTNASDNARQAIQEYYKELSSDRVSVDRLDYIEKSLKRINTAQHGLGKISSFAKQWGKEAISQLTSIGSSALSFMEIVNTAKKGIATITELDTSLVDLRKTTSMNRDELEAFYYSSNDVAKQMGVSTKEIIDQASSWSRLGYSTSEAATQMAKIASQFKLISPGMSSDEATSGLVSIMKAYDIDVENVLDGIMSKVNVIGNKFALSNADIIAMLQDSVSAMKEANNSLEETIALETAAYEIAQDRSVGKLYPLPTSIVICY